MTFCRTPAPRSGPSVARNIATRQARADIIACLDADDAYAPDRLRLLLPLVEKYGVATGPTREIDPRTRATRTARPRAGGAFLPIEDICELRMPFSPVYQKAKCPAGWSQIDFAEDVILNVDLSCACGAYPFVEGAEYIYHLSDGSRSHSAQTLCSGRARATCRSSSWSTSATGRRRCESWCGGCSTRTWPRSSERSRPATARPPGARSCATALQSDHAADSPSRASRRRSQAIIGRVSSTIQALPTTWPAR